MRLKPLKPVFSHLGEPSAQINVRCKITGASKAWNEAAQAGWVCDLNGPPFRDYYSPEGLKQVNGGSQDKNVAEPVF